VAAEIINWREWGEGAFAEAAKSDKLILLDISAVWCHWCHVMDETSYSDHAIAELVNGRYVPVRVDTDRMPDVNERYNMGGWPTTAVMTPGGEVLLGATYVPPDKLKEALTSLDSFYHENKDEIKVRIEQLKAKKLADYGEAITVPPGDVTENITAYVLEELDRNYDPVHGGFGIDPKFPLPDALDLLLTAYKDTGRQDYLSMAEKTMEGMSGYGMYDQVMGGFFRYSVTRDWSVPHFEKMTESNSGLIVNCIDLYRLTGSTRFMDTIKKTLDYVDAWLWSDAGHFCGSQDADEEYYKLDMDERQKRKAPYVDKTAYANLNAKMAVAYMHAYELLGGAAYRDKALAALDFVLTNMLGAKGGLYHYYDGKPGRSCLLSDQSAMVKALLSAFQTTGVRRWLDEAVKLITFMDDTYWDGEHGGGYFDLPDDPEAVGALKYRVKPMNENAEIAAALKALYVITGDERYRDRAYDCLLPHSKAYREFGFMAAGYALAVDYVLKPETEVTVVGGEGADDTGALIRAVNEVFIPRRILRVLYYERDKDEIGQRGYNTSGRAAAYICRESVCTARVEDAGELKKKLRDTK